MAVFFSFKPSAELLCYIIIQPVTFLQSFIFHLNMEMLLNEVYFTAWLECFGTFIMMNRIYWPFLPV